MGLKGDETHSSVLLLLSEPQFGWATAVRGAGAVPMRLISFLFYYCKVRVGTISATYRTYHPLDIKWRWQHWQRMERSAGK